VADRHVVLGVDPGLTRCGIGVVVGPAARPRSCSPATACGPTGRCRSSSGSSPCTTRSVPRSPPTGRMRSPSSGCCSPRNVRTAMATGQAAGSPCSPPPGRRAGRGLQPDRREADRRGFRHRRQGRGRAAGGRAARLDAPPTPADVADALAVALTHLARSRLAAAARTGAAGAARRRGAHRGLRGSGLGGGPRRARVSRRRPPHVVREEPARDRPPARVRSPTGRDERRRRRPRRRLPRPRDPRRTYPASWRAGRAAHLAAGPRGVDDPLRVHRPARWCCSSCC
jgi:crossover junction endodeoxyribonuclease RuvC